MVAGDSILIGVVFERVSTADQNRLVLESAAGNEESLRKLITSLMPLVRELTGEWKPSPDRRLEHDDVVGYGITGIGDAVRRYKPEEGDFGNYVGSRIKGAIQDAFRIAENKTVRLSVDGQKKLNRWDKIKAELEKELGREPEIQEVAQRSGILVEDYEALKLRSEGEREPFDGARYGRRVNDPGFDFVDKRDTINYLLENSRLSRHQRKIVELAYGFRDPSESELEKVEEGRRQSSKPLNYDHITLSGLRVSDGGLRLEDVGYILGSKTTAVSQSLKNALRKMETVGRRIGSY